MAFLEYSGDTPEMNAHIKTTQIYIKGRFSFLLLSHFFFKDPNGQTFIWDARLADRT